MSLEVGFETQVPSLPRGGGALGGLGESFSPDLSTGTGSFAVPLDMPNGPNDIGPRLVLRYDTGSGAGAFGLGWSLPLPRIVRSIARGYPRYDNSDALVLEGAGELVRVGGEYRPQVDGGLCRVRAEGGGLRVTDRAGHEQLLGVSPAARLHDPADPARVLAWHLERIEDPLGNAAVLEWMREPGGALYLAAVRYGEYEVRFEYEPRPDVIRWGRAGFLLVSTQRCARIELRLPGSAQPLLRRWSLDYQPDPENGASLLSRITLTGYDEQGGELAAPRLALGYSSFGPPDLVRLKNEHDGAPPAALGLPHRRVELIDWDGNGLPDLVELGSGGAVRLWPNRGDGEWGDPRPAGCLPTLAAPGTAFGLFDMDGDGQADLVRTDRPMSGFVPRVPGAGFAQPRGWNSAPPVAPADPGARMLDADGDGLTDLLVEGRRGGLMLYYRQDPEGWSTEPQVILPGQAPEVRLSDPHTFLADMTGDGSSDLVRITGGGVLYWPYLGRGRWDAPVVMENPPALPYDLDPRRLFLVDLDGDGCSDLIYLDSGLVRYWMNQGGCRFGEERTVDFVPTGQIQPLRLADTRGSGMSGLLWSAPGPLGRAARYFYLDFGGGVKPHLLTTIDNGLGLTTRVAYSTSAREAARDAHEGHAWSTQLPVVVPIVAGVTTTDGVSGRVSETRYRYHEGRYDGTLREFAGFGRVEADELGDETAPTLRTVRLFLTGADPADPGRPLALEERRRLRAVRGRLIAEERFGIDGTLQQDLPYDRTEWAWDTPVEHTSGGDVFTPRLIRTVKTIFEREALPAARVTSENQAWDEQGNVTESVETSEVMADPSQTRRVRTLVEYAQDPTGRFRSCLYRRRQFDLTGALLSASVTLYAGAPEGNVGPQGLVAEEQALAFTDALVAELYESAPPDFASLGYFRRPGEDGWWVSQARYHRVDDAGGLRGFVTGPLGAVTRFTFNSARTHPTEIVDPMGNTLHAEHDPRINRTVRVMDPGGAVYQAQYDALARPSASIAPGDDLLRPTTVYEYDAASQPVWRATHTRAVSGQPATLDRREFFDGEGAVLQERVCDGSGEIARRSYRYGARRLLSEQAAAFVPPSAAYAPPDASVRRTLFAYDALGRVTSRRTPDGGRHTLRYGPLWIEEADPEDNAPASPHAGTPSRKRLDASGRLSALEQRLGAQVLTSRYAYNPRGQITTFTDPTGSVVRLWYDLLGRLIRVERPESGTVAVLDAAGNAVESRRRDGRKVLRHYDAANRLEALRFDDPATPPAVRLFFQDAGASPPGAFAGCLGGRLARVEDQSGVTLFGYDACGRLARKRSLPAGLNQSFDLDFTYRADGQLNEVIYPEGGTGRQVLRHEYNALGQLVRIPSFVKALHYDLEGRRTRIAFANGTQQSSSYDPLSGRLVQMQLDGPDGLLREAHYATDLVGNIARISSPDPTVAAEYAYDDLYRLVGAHAGDGREWTYGYDPAGNLIHTSDLGDFSYGENNAPSTCLTTAGPWSLSWNVMGELVQAPWGQQEFDPLGGLERLTLPDGQCIEFAKDFGGAVAAIRRNGQLERVMPDRRYAIEGGELVLNVLLDRLVVARLGPNSNMQFLHADHLGSPVMVTGRNGERLRTVRYDPYGAVLDQSGSAPEPIGYTGGLPLDETNLLLLGARWYHPALGRFISPDVIVQQAEDPLAWNPYLYCRANPLRYIDPSGRGFWDWFLPVIAIVALVVVAIVVPPLAPVIVTGMVLGGIIGGVSAGVAGGDAADIFKGILTGAAVGGATAVAAHFAAPAVAGGLGLNGFWGSVVSGAVKGLIVGAGTGFSAGYAGGKGSLDDILKKTFMGAVLGGTVGSIAGAWSTHAAPAQSPLEAGYQPSKELAESAKKAAETWYDPRGWLDVLNRASNLLPNTASAVIQNGLEHLAPQLGGELMQLVVVDTVVTLYAEDVKRKWIADFSLGLYVADVLGPLTSEVVNPVLKEAGVGA